VPKKLTTVTLWVKVYSTRIKLVKVCLKLLLSNIVYHGFLMCLMRSLFVLHTAYFVGNWVILVVMFICVNPENMGNRIVYRNSCS
jgi:hypothetical protein